jgi:hypothetical protein
MLRRALVAECQEAKNGWGKEAMRAATTDDPLTPGYVPSAHRFAIDVPPYGDY